MLHGTNTTVSISKTKNISKYQKIVSSKSNQLIKNDAELTIHRHKISQHKDHSSLVCMLPVKEDCLPVQFSTVPSKHQEVVLKNKFSYVSSCQNTIDLSTMFTVQQANATNPSSINIKTYTGFSCRYAQQ